MQSVQGNSFSAEPGAVGQLPLDAVLEQLPQPGFNSAVCQIICDNVIGAYALETNFFQAVWRYPV